MINITTMAGTITIGMGYVAPAAGIGRGSYVNAGQVIGTMQNIQVRTGTSVTPHVHIQIHMGTMRLNPTVLIPPSF